MDAVSKIAVRNIIREINRDHGTTIILTTHDTQDIEALTNRILLIGKGRLLLDGDLQMLKKHYSSAKHISIDYTPFPRGGSASDLMNIQESGISVAGTEAAGTLALQLFWVIFLTILGHYLM